MNVPSAKEDRLRRRVNQYLKTGQLAAAQSALESLQHRFPNDYRIQLALADVLLDQGQLRNSESHLLHILQQQLRRPDYYLELVHRLYRSGNIIAARQCLEISETFANLPGEMVAAQAHLRWMLGEIIPAKSRIEQAIRLNVDTPDEHYLHAALLQFVGSIDEAEQVLQSCIQRWPTFGGAAMALAKLKKQATENNHVDYLRRIIGRIPKDSAAPNDKLILAEFEAALFKEFDDLGRYDEAWQSLSSSNRLMQELNPYDPSSEEALVDALINNFSSMKKVAAAPLKKHPGPIPIFIIGMPRSGSTLLDRMLSSHSEVASAGEINDMLKQVHWLADMPFDGPRSTVRALERVSVLDLEIIGVRYLEQTQWRARGFPYYIDKLPANVQWVSVIRRALPHAPIIHITREPMDLCFSNFKAMFGNASAYSYDIKSLVHYYFQYQRLVRYWHEVLPGSILDVSYESLVDNPVAAITRVLDHCQLSFEDACIHPELNSTPVATPSSAQVREAIHKRASEQWKHYGIHLKPLIDALATNPRI